MEKIYDWQDITDEFRDTLVIGNGASVAVHQGFNYGSLKKAAENAGFLTQEVQEVFDQLGTSDFELVLELLWRAREVNKALGMRETRTARAYIRVRNALIKTVREVHCDYQDAEGHLHSIQRFMGRFRTVLSLNYDLLVYWALLHGNSLRGGRHRFKDCFSYGQFNPYGLGLEDLRKPDLGLDRATLVFYPHGNLALVTKPQYLGRDRMVVKVNARGSQLLGMVLDAWREDPPRVPCFVSEGLYRQKEVAIQDKAYLSWVYDEAVGDRSDTLAIYGWGLSDNDLHLLRKLFGTPKRRVAVSIHMPRYLDKNQVLNENKLEEDLNHIEGTIKEASRASGSGPPEIVFFDTRSEGCWNG